MDVWYEFVLAQMASDSYLDDEFEPFNFKDEEQLVERLRNGANHYNYIDDLIAAERSLSATRMTNVMVSDFNSAWEIIDHLPNTTSGFSATVLKHKVTDAYTLSFRSTESKDAIDGGDVERDSFNGANGQISFDGFAWGQLRDMENYYRHLQSGVLATGSAADGAALAAALSSEPINLTGYSLGGHLVQAFTLMHPDSIEQAYTFNGAGIGTIENLDPLTEYGPAILERIDTLNAVMADPSAYLEHFDADVLSNIVDDLQDGTLVNLVTGPPFLKAMLEFVTDLRDAVFGGVPPARVYDDPFFKLALSVLPADTTGAAAVGILEFTNYTREQITAHERITNLYGHSFSGERVLDEFTAGAGQISGGYFPIYIEDQPLLAADVDLLPLSLDAILRSFGPTHSIALVADSLAVMALYAAIDPSLVAGDETSAVTMGLNSLFESITNTRARLLASPKGEGNTLEVALDSLGHLALGEAWQPTAWNDAPGAYGDLEARDAFHVQLQRLRHALFENDTLKPVFSGLKILPLVDIDAATLAQRAETETAYRYALHRLNPFVVTGSESIYVQHNPVDDTGSGILDSGQFSSAYWFDRATFLLGLTDANVDSRSTPNGDPTVLSGADIEYLDATNGRLLHEATPYRVTIQRASDDVILHDAPAGKVSRVTFSNGAMIAGSSGDDRLYGEQAANTLIGNRGEDKLEGGNGDDTLYGNDASNADDDAPDLLQGGRGADSYYANVRDIIDDLDGAGRITFRDHLLEAGYREALDAPDAYTSRDGRHTYLHDANTGTLTVTGKSGDPAEVLTIANFTSGRLGITLHENPQPVDTQFLGSGADDTITVNPAGTEITGVIDGKAIDPAATFTPHVDVIAARGGDDLVTVPGDIARIRIHGDHFVGGAADEGHDYIAVDVVRVAADAVASEVDGGARIFGGGGNDRIQGGQRNDELLGESGNDWISGHHGDDRISGGDDASDSPDPDNDVLIGGPGSDELFGHGGDDALFGGQGVDTLQGGAGDDAVYGDLITWAYDVANPGAWSGPSNSWNDDGIYIATAGTGAVLTKPNVAGDHVVFEAAVDAAAGADNLDGGAGDDHLLGGYGDDQLAGGADRDLLEGEEGNDTLFGGGGNDILYGDISPATFANHSAVLDSGMAPDGHWTLSFREFLHGPDAGGDDTLDGGAGTDTLIGGVGDDSLDGGRFDRAIDVLYGGTGNDAFAFGFGDGSTFVYDEDGGADRIVFRAGVTPDDVHFEPDATGSSLVVSVTLNGIDIGDELIISNWYRGNTVESFTFDNGLIWTTAFIEAETGRNIDATDPVDNGGVILAATDQADVSLGNSGNNEVYLLAGDDSFAGGSGNDRVFGGTGDDVLQGNDGDDVISGEADDDQLYGQAGNDLLYGGAGADALSGGGGADSLFGGPGADNLLGGLDNDSYIFHRGDGDDFIRDDGGTADRIVFEPTITPADVTVGASGNTILFDVRAHGALVGDRLTVVDGFLATTEIEVVEFTDGTIWNIADITARLPDSYALDDGVAVTGGANATTYTLASSLADGFTMAITDAGGIDVLDLRSAISGSGALSPNLNGTSRSGDDLLLDISIDSTISTIPNAAGEIRINNFYTEAGFVETIRVGSTAMNAENAAPVVASPPDDQLIPLATPYNFTVPEATFADSAFDRFTLSTRLSDGRELPAWLAFDSATGAFSGIPDAGDAAILELAVIATDVEGLTAVANFGLNVGNVNVAPVLSVPISPRSALEGNAFSFALAAEPFVDANLADTLTFSARLAGGDPLPEWLFFNGQTSTFSGTPETADVELLLVEVTATDSGALGATGIFTLNVDYLNDAPDVTIVPADVALTEHRAFSFALPVGTFTDSDRIHGDSLAYTLSTPSGAPLPGWLLFDDETLTFSGRPVGIVADQDFKLQLTATDNDGAKATANFYLNVTDVAAADAWYVPQAVTAAGAPAYARAGSVTAALHDGNYVVVWESAGRDEDARGIYAQPYRASGVAVGATVQVNTTTLGDQRALAVAALNDGGFVVSWVSSHEDDGYQVPPLHDGGGIYAQLFAADASPVGSETRVNHVWSGIQNQTAIAALSDGGYVITWFSQFNEQRINVVEYGIGEPGLFGQRYSASGAPVNSAVRLADVGIADLEPSVAGLLDGGFVMAWTAEDGDGAGIVAQRYFAGGTKSGPEIRVNSSVEDQQSDPQVTALATGGFVVVWRSEDQDSSGGGVYGQRFSITGAPVGNEFRVNTTTFGTQGDPAVSATPDGGFVVSWVSAPINGIGDLYMQRYGADGLKRDSETLVDAADFQNDAP
ncbi:MAG: putative Ig domain-containing protein, partial [Gammaproteobacteria bacterium]